MKTSSTSLPVAVERCYALWLWLDARVAAMPASARRSVGDRVLDAVLDALEALVDATWHPRTSAACRDALARASLRLAVLRLLLRGARERRYLSIPQWEYAAERVTELGRMVGGWLRSTERDGA